MYSCDTVQADIHFKWTIAKVSVNSIYDYRAWVVETDIVSAIRLFGPAEENIFRGVDTETETDIETIVLVVVWLISAFMALRTSSRCRWTAG